MLTKARCLSLVVLTLLAYVHAQYGGYGGYNRYGGNGAPGAGMMYTANGALIGASGAGMMYGGTSSPRPADKAIQDMINLVKKDIIKILKINPDTKITAIAYTTGGGAGVVYTILLKLTEGTSSYPGDATIYYKPWGDGPAYQLMDVKASRR